MKKHWTMYLPRTTGNIIKDGKKQIRLKEKIAKAEKELEILKQK